MGLNGKLLLFIDFFSCNILDIWSTQTLQLFLLNYWTMLTNLKVWNVNQPILTAFKISSELKPEVSTLPMSFRNSLEFLLFDRVSDTLSTHQSTELLQHKTPEWYDVVAESCLLSGNPKSNFQDESKRRSWQELVKLSLHH